MSDQPSPVLHVFCLCAAWCGTCTSYQALFTQLSRECPQHAWHWVDIEDHADLLDDWDIENFPTVLIAQGQRPLFMGVLTPHVETLRRLVQAHESGQASVAVTDELAQLTLRLTSRVVKP